MNDEPITFQETVTTSERREVWVVGPGCDRPATPADLAAAGYVPAAMARANTKLEMLGRELVAAVSFMAPDVHEYTLRADGTVSSSSNAVIAVLKRAHAMRGCR